MKTEIVDLWAIERESWKMDEFATHVRRISRRMVVPLTSNGCNSVLSILRDLFSSMNG